MHAVKSVRLLLELPFFLRHNPLHLVIHHEDIWTQGHTPPSLPKWTWLSGKQGMTIQGCSWSANLPLIENACRVVLGKGLLQPSQSALKGRTNATNAFTSAKYPSRPALATEWHLLNPFLYCSAVAITHYLYRTNDVSFTNPFSFFSQRFTSSSCWLITPTQQINSITRDRNLIDT